jgi:dihydrofolate reductase
VSISLIVAATKNHVIGKDGAMPWHLPADLQYFKKITMGKPIIMGRKTFDSIGRPLPGRRNIVVTQNRAWSHQGVEVVHDIADALTLVQKDEAFVIGGATLYAAALPVASRVYLTAIDATIDGDTFFPALDQQTWREIAHEHRAKDEKNAHDLDFIVYARERA